MDNLLLTTLLWTISLYTLNVLALKQSLYVFQEYYGTSILKQINAGAIMIRDMTYSLRMMFTKVFHDTEKCAYYNVRQKNRHR